MPSVYGSSSTCRERGRPRMPCELAELVHAARVLARDQLPLVLFLVAGDPAPGVHAPDLLVLRAEAQLVERHPELGGPTRASWADLAVPDRVPGGVPLRLAVAEDQVDLAAPGRQVELEARALVVVAVEADADHVDGVAQEVVAAARVAVDLRRVVVGADREVDVLVVVEDLELGRLGRRRALDRKLLLVVARPLSLLPRLVVEPPVDRRGLSLETHRLVDAGRVLAAEGFATGPAAAGGGVVGACPAASAAARHATSASERARRKSGEPAKPNEASAGRVCRSMEHLPQSACLCGPLAV